MEITKITVGVSEHDMEPMKERSNHWFGTSNFPLSISAIMERDML